MISSASFSKNRNFYREDNMPKNNQSTNSLLAALGLVFGAGAGVLLSVVCSFSIWAGIAGGAALGLLVGLIASNLFGKQSGARKNDHK